MRVCKQGATRGQAIDMGRLGLGVPFKHGWPIVQVVNRNEEDVARLRCSRAESEEERAKSEEEQDRFFHR